MKIISGSAKSRRLKTPKGSKIIRPALSQVREAIFSSLGDLTGKVVLDIFAGTGSLGLEALSRGCEMAYFVDSHPQAIGIIIENLKILGFEDRAHVFKRRMPRELDTLQMAANPGFIFCDPPYDKNLINPTLTVLARQPYVDGETLILVEHTRREWPTVPALEILKQKKFGQTFVSFLRKVA